MFNGGRSEGARAGCSMEGGLRVQGLVVQWREALGCKGWLSNGGRSEGARAGCSMEGDLRVQGLVVQRREV